MKNYLFVVASVAILFASCSKQEPIQNSTALENDKPASFASADLSTSQLTSAQIAWLNQMAGRKADSLAKVNALPKSVAAQNPAAATSLLNRSNMMIAIVEANDHAFSNVAAYVDSDGKPVFDLAFPFSANLNINPTTKKPYVYYNPQHQAMLKNGTFTKVQKAGVKVGLSLLGNHDDAGFANFKNQAEATAFAQIVAYEVRTKAFDAVLTDDEWSNAVAGAASNSYDLFMSALKKLLPEIYLCYYRFGATATIYDASFTPFYPQETTLTGPKAFSSTSETDGSFPDPATVCANSRKNNNGGMMFYNVCGNSSSPAFYAPYALALKGKKLVVKPGSLNPTIADFVNGR